METMKWPAPKPEFRTRANGVTMGDKSGRKRGATSFEANPEVGQIQQTSVCDFPSSKIKRRDNL